MAKCPPGLRAEGAREAFFSPRQRGVGAGAAQPPARRARGGRALVWRVPLSPLFLAHRARALSQPAQAPVFFQTAKSTKAGLSLLPAPALRISGRFHAARPRFAAPGAAPVFSKKKRAGASAPARISQHPAHGPLRTHSTETHAATSARDAGFSRPGAARFPAFSKKNQAPPLEARPSLSSEVLAAPGRFQFSPRDDFRHPPSAGPNRGPARLSLGSPRARPGR